MHEYLQLHGWPVRAPRELYRDDLSGAIYVRIHPNSFLLFSLSFSSTRTQLPGGMKHFHLCLQLLRSSSEEQQRAAANAKSVICLREGGEIPKFAMPTAPGGGDCG